MEENEQDFQNSDSQENFNEQNPSSEFSIPDEYKEKGWTKFFDGKTGEELKTELFRSYDNSQTLIGKKVEDYLTQTDLSKLDNFNEIKEALTKQIAPNNVIPDSAENYALNDILKGEDGNLLFEYPNEALEYFGSEFKNLGLTKEQGQGLLKVYTDFELKEFEKYTNQNDLDNDLNKMFGNNQTEKKKVEGLLKEFLPVQDQQFLQKTAPNYTIEMFYKLAKGLISKYGYEENSSGAGKQNNMRMSEAERNAEYNRLAKMLDDLDNRPQQVGEKEAIVKQMRELFK